MLFDTDIPTVSRNTNAYRLFREGLALMDQLHAALDVPPRRYLVRLDEEEVRLVKVCLPDGVVIEDCAGLEHMEEVYATTQALRPHVERFGRGELWWPSTPPEERR